MAYYTVGTIVNTHGIKGEVRVMAITDFPESRFAVGSTLYAFQKGQPKPSGDQPAQAGQAAQTGKMMMYIFPVMSVWICFKYNTSFAIYWTLSSLLMILVNLILAKKFPAAQAAAREEEKK